MPFRRRDVLLLVTLTWACNGNLTSPLEPAQSTVQGNLLQDPSFESQLRPRALDAPWASESAGNALEAGVDLVGYALTGAKSAFIFAPNATSSTDWTDIYQDVSVQANATYHLSASIKPSNVRDGALGVKVNGQVLQQTAYQGSSQYSAVSVDFNSGQNTSLRVFVGMHASQGQTSAINLDDLSLTSTRTVSGRSSPISYPAGNRCLDVAMASQAVGAQVQIWDCNGTAAQSFSTAAGTLAYGSRCLGVSGAGNNSSPVVVQDCDGSDGQQWSFDSSRGTIAGLNGRCLDARGAGTTNGTIVQLYDCNGTQAQKWALGTTPPTPTPPTPTPPTPPPAGNPTPIVDVTPGAQVVRPGDNIPAIVQACSSGTVHFSAGIYSLTGSINVPPNCRLEGEVNWASIITGGVGGNGTLFQLNHSSNVTVTRLHFQNVSGTVIGNWNAPGSGLIQKTHIYLNYFDHVHDNVAIVFLDPANMLIERNAFNYMGRDGVHLFASGVSGSLAAQYPDQQNIVLRWNFGANMDYLQASTGQNDTALLELQVVSKGINIFQNVYYSQAGWQGQAFSIASAGVPCSGLAAGGSFANGPFVGCLPPDNGTNGLIVDGNIILNNGINGPTPPGSPFGGFETMGVSPIVQNNYQRGWGAMSFTEFLEVYNPATNNYSHPFPAPVVFQNNTACDVGAGQVTTANGLVTSEAHDNQPPVVAGSGGNKYSTSCAMLAPPALPPQVVVPPELLDGSGGLWALQANNVIPGANTYWPKVNTYQNYEF